MFVGEPARCLTLGRVIEEPKVLREMLIATRRTRSKAGGDEEDEEGEHGAIEREVRALQALEYCFEAEVEKDPQREEMVGMTLDEMIELMGKRTEHLRKRVDNDVTERPAQSRLIQERHERA